MRCFSPPSCAWWDRVLISFPMWTPAVWVSTGSFSPTLDLHPYSNPSDRGYNYAVPYDPDIVDLFNLFGRVKRFYERTYNYSLQSTELKNSPGEEYSADFDYINFEFDPGIWASSNGGFGWRAQVAGHEYFHAIDDAISDSPPFCTEANGVLGIVGAAGCVV